MKLIFLVLLLFAPAMAFAQCTPNPNDTAPPFVDGCPLPAVGLNNLAGQIAGKPSCPSTTAVQNLSCWDNTTGTLLKDCAVGPLHVGNQTNWLDPIVPNSLNISNLGVLSPQNGIAVIGAVRTSDTPSSGFPAFGFGVTGIGINDEVVRGPSFDVWGLFASAIRTPTAHVGNQAIGIESDISEGHDYSGANKETPYGFAANHTAAGWFASCDAGPSTVCHPVSVGVGILNNGATPQGFVTGLLFTHDALLGDDGTNGVGEAISIPKGEEINWYEPTTAQQSASIRSDAVNATKQVQLIFGVGTFQFTSTADEFFNFVSTANDQINVQFLDSSFAVKWVMGKASATDAHPHSFFIADAVHSANILFGDSSGNTFLGEGATTEVFLNGHILMGDIPVTGGGNKLLCYNTSTKEVFVATGGPPGTC